VKLPQVKPTVGIMILNHNGKDWLPGLYDSLLADPYERRQIYLVDNHSDDGSCEMTMTEYKQVKVLSLPKNFGYSAAYNLCIPLAIADGCHYVIWSNNDVVIEPCCLGKLVEAAMSDPQIGIVGPALLGWGSNEPNVFMKENYPHLISAVLARSEAPMDVEWVEGSFPLVSVRCLNTIGYLDPYLHLGSEDADFCRRARHQGWRVVLAPAAGVHHYGGAWTNASAKNMSFHIRCRAKNYYVYKLTNPGQPFIRNLLEAIHLFAVRIKACLLAPGKNLGTEIAIFSKVLLDWKTIYTKWKRDLACWQPPRLSEDTSLVHVEIAQKKDQVLQGLVQQL